MKTDKIYVISGYKPATEPYGPQDSDVIGFCKTKEEADKWVEKLEDKYIPKHLSYSDIDMIGWRYKNNFKAYLEDGKWLPRGLTAEKDGPELRKDWEKYGGSWGRPIYCSFSIDEVGELRGELPKCRYIRHISENRS